MPVSRWDGLADEVFDRGDGVGIPSQGHGDREKVRAAAVRRHGVDEIAEECEEVLEWQEIMSVIMVQAADKGGLGCEESIMCSVLGEGGADVMVLKVFIVMGSE